MALWANFIGGTYQALSPIIAADQAVNIYAESRQIAPKVKATTFYGTPGLSLFATVDTTGCRGWFTQDDLTLTVVGDQLYTVDVAAATATALGTIPDDGRPVFFASNGAGGDQVGIVGAGRLHVYDTVAETLVPATLPFADPVMIAFLDGYGLINQAGTPIVWYSALEDFTTWDALDFFARSGTSDNLVGIGVSRDRVWCFGSETTTLFYDSGDADTPFLPYPGTTVQVGLLSPTLLGVYDDTFYWVGQTATGESRVYSAASEPKADVRSTPPIDRFLASATDLASAEMLIYEQAGHPFVAITAPTSTEPVQTYVYDALEGLWQARAGWDSTLGVWTRWRARGATATSGVVLVGDYATGDLYTLDLSVYADNGAILKRERTAPYLSDENQWIFLDQLELGMQPGVGLSSGQGSAPVVHLEISRDGARTWVSAGEAALGPMGGYDARAIWRHLGRARADRVVARITQTDPVPCVWGPGLWLRLTSGTGQI